MVLMGPRIGPPGVGLRQGAALRSSDQAGRLERRGCPGYTVEPAPGKSGRWRQWRRDRGRFGTDPRKKVDEQSGPALLRERWI